jgi:hypothetical protein
MPVSGIWTLKNKTLVTLQILDVENLMTLQILCTTTNP